MKERSEYCLRESVLQQWWENEQRKSVLILWNIDRYQNYLLRTQRINIIVRQKGKHIGIENSHRVLLVFFLSRHHLSVILVARKIVVLLKLELRAKIEMKRALMHVRRSELDQCFICLSRNNEPWHRDPTFQCDPRQRGWWSCRGGR